MKIWKKSAKIENFKMKSSRPKIVFLVSGTQKNGLEFENQNFVFASGGSLNKNSEFDFDSYFGKNLIMRH